MTSFPTSWKPSVPFVFSIAEYENSPFNLSERYILKRVQSLRNNVFLYLSIFFTAVTSIEMIFPVPLILFCLGADAAGTISLIYSLVLVFGTQVLKRFLWRPRPWMLDETIAVWKRDKTSSFPSRGVVCSVVFSFLLSDAFHWDHPIWFSLLVVSFSTLTAFSRLYLGAHFLSDVVAGLVIGFLLVFVSRKLLLANFWTFLGCDILTNPGTCYGTATIWHMIVSKLLSLIVLTVILWCFTLALTCSPLMFWSKSALSLGPEQNDKDALGFVLERNWLLSCIGIVGPLALWSIGWYLSKKQSGDRNILYYTFLFVSSCILLVICSLQRVAS